MHNKAWMYAMGLALGLAVSLAAGCRALPGSAPDNAPPEPPAVGPVQVAPTDAVRYQIDGGQSRIEILVFRGGRLARLGHNHVITIREVSGEVLLAQPLSASTLSLHAAKAAFVVDDPQARAQAGSEFPAELPEDARRGTARNMLSESLLSAAAYPDVHVRSVAVTGQSPYLHLQVAVTVLDEPRILTLPVELVLETDRLLASGEADVTHEQLGLTPFSALLGALKVQETFTVRYTLAAVRE